MTDRPFRDALVALQQRPYGLKNLQTGLRPTVREWLGACVLDHLGWTPEMLLDGVSLVVCQDSEVEHAVMDMVRLLYRRVIWHRGSRVVPHDGGLTLLDTSSAEPDDDYDDAVNCGAPVVVVCVDASKAKPHAAVMHSTRRATIDVPLTADVVSALVDCVTGTRVDVPDALAVRLAVIDVVRAVHFGSTPQACLDRIAATVAAYDAEDDAPIARKATAVPLAKAADNVVRRLSEMTGFGEAGVWGCNLAADLHAYRAGTLPWADVDRGLLLSGPPGGGKTTFARALALECEVDLVVTTYSEWSSAGGTYGDAMMKGMAKLFDTWRKKATKGPFLLFVDEIDSMGVRGGAAHNESWFSPIVNAWLAFLDGALPRDGIVVVGATNYPDRVDPAMLRPGRLDRHRELPMPDIDALAGIVRAHLGADAMLTDAEVAEAARAVRGRSPADVAQLAREARRIARWCKRRVCASDLTDVVAMSRRPETADNARLVAVHEAAHAVAGVVLDADVLLRVDVDAGRTSYETRPFVSAAQVEARVCMMLAARAAEEVMIGAPTTGASQDLQDATVQAMAMHAGWGYGAAGLVHVPVEVAARDARIMTAVRVTLDAAYARAVALVTEHRAAIDRVAVALVRQRYLDAAEVRALVAGPVPVSAPVRRSAPCMSGKIKRTVGPRTPGPR